MRYLSVAAIFTTLIVGAEQIACAADPAPAYNWSGLYAGLNMGVGLSRNDVNTTGQTLNTNPAHSDSLANATASAAGVTATISTSGASFIGGGQIGYSLQLQNWLAGVEADIDGLSPSNRTSSAQVVTPIAGAGTNTSLDTATKTLNYLGTIRARGGFLVTPALLLYATGGLAYGHAGLTTDIVQSRTPKAFGTSPAGGTSSSSTRFGWSLGAGAEWMVLPNLSARLEYLHYDLGSLSNSFVMSHYNQRGALTFTNQISSKVQLGGNLIRVGLNFHF